MRLIGLMSGTSMDGVDAALIETDGARVTGLGPTAAISYDEELRARIREACAIAAILPKRDDSHPEIRRTARLLTEVHAEAVDRVRMSANLDPGAVDAIGFHGQTIRHRPEAGWTWQIGDAAWLAGRCGIDVVADFRSNDMAQGGEGAPLAPFYHTALCRSRIPGLRAPGDWPAAILNIGGVANVTYIAAPGASDADLLAFDTGPGNALIDDWVRRHGGGTMDEGGAIAAKGRVDEAVLTELLDHPYFDVRPPKSLDRDAFTVSRLEGLSLGDGAATLTAFTAGAVARSLQHMSVRPKAVYVCGGGRRNPTLMRMLHGRLNVPVEPVEALGWRGDMLEAEAFAFLAARSLLGLPLSAPGTTRVRALITGGVLFRSKAAARLRT